MQQAQQRSDGVVIDEIDACHEQISRARRRLFELIAEVDRREAWRDAGARDVAHWLWMRYGISEWKARRWIASARALPQLQLIADAFASGLLSTDKVVELTRFATPEDEGDLIRWAAHVSSGAIRRKADLAVVADRDAIVDADQARLLAWWYFDEGRRFGIEGELPAAQGALVAKALERLAETLPVMPDADGPWHASSRRADALVALCSERIAGDPDQDRATIVIHARADSLDAGGALIDGGPPIHPDTTKRLLCNARMQTVVEDGSGTVLGVGRLSREPTAWMLRQIRHRDQECRFPGCGARRFTQAHHIVWWSKGGRTDLDNLVLICSFHHKLVHEYGWVVRRDPDGSILWFREDGGRYLAGPSPGSAAVA